MKDRIPFRLKKLSLSRLIESKHPQRKNEDEYRRGIRDYYDGPAGWFTRLSGVFTGHETMAGKLISPKGFDVRGCGRILDAACGNGRYLRVLQRRADPGTTLVGFDLSKGMLRRAHGRIKGARPHLMTADLVRLPYRDAAFDAVVCGWVLEHLQNPLPGLRELARVLRPGGKLLILTTEQTLTGAICSRCYRCRTTRRQDLRLACEQAGLSWGREHWWSPLHKVLRLGGIVVELKRAKDNAGDLRTAAVTQGVRSA
jgi:ubiquinone/menaquinone biosynthesis C-methylase UbiE